MKKDDRKEYIFYSIFLQIRTPIRSIVLLHNTKCTSLLSKKKEERSDINIYRMIRATVRSNIFVLIRIRKKC